MVVKKTALLIDTELVEQVKQILGATTTTETIHESLREVIRMRGRARGLERLRRREGLDFDEGTAQDAWRHKRDDLGEQDGPVPRGQERPRTGAPR
ncbi:MAG: type II toxin-antitoxin system VapB family antitoxin [Acidimicrobiales bacterium]